MSKEIKTLKYKVIANFPMSLFNIGDTIEVYENSGNAYMVGDIDERTYKCCVFDYPHLFELVPDSTQQ